MVCYWGIDVSCRYYILYGHRHVGPFLLIYREVLIGHVTHS